VRGSFAQHRLRSIFKAAVFFWLQCSFGIQTQALQCSCRLHPLFKHLGDGDVELDTLDGGRGVGGGA